MREHAKQGTSKPETSLAGPRGNGTVKRFTEIALVSAEKKFSPVALRIFFLAVLRRGVARNRARCFDEFPRLEKYRNILYQNLLCHRRNRGFLVIRSNHSRPLLVFHLASRLLSGMHG